MLDIVRNFTNKWIYPYIHMIYIKKNILNVKIFITLAVNLLIDYTIYIT